MENSALFWALLVTAFILISSIISHGRSMKAFIKSDAFKQKLDNFKKSKTLKTVIMLMAYVAASSSVLAQEAEIAEEVTVSFYTSEKIYVLLAIDITLVLIMVYQQIFFSKLINIDKKEEETVQVEAYVKQTTSKISNILTDAVPVEEEKNILLDHEYDGIKELDNNLPPWWKYGFYISIAASVIYLLNYHVFKISPLQEEEYAINVEEAEQEVQAYLTAQALNVDENTVVMLNDASDISDGKILYDKFCIACHKEGGAGDVGPNLTDDYWIHGGRINDIFKVIKYGAQNGMKSWKDDFTGVQIQQISSYIKTLRGTNPPNAKEAQGELYMEETTTDTLNVE
ncbi:cbb3-type cytochrome c oxidase N-terminal domain-containing protein [Brumimicrobium aurantiacum]|uniref:Cytochrome C oxidase subunit III n=1 Tax=Brumimicrobium aurantiacum TaxID=1737063 RepID=A0A3E1EUY6_9FLAO|nr:cbb3-type cytochrome c oxidase N-terminal domain-containing protein [Brumimicrobium aurantiacum]RFC53374.1 cytochrome C oxidase subunit III [Brumimicrobium aurantiacum]